MEKEKVVMRRKLVSAALALGMVFTLTSCFHSHTWEEATCTTPKTCSECGETEGEALGHTWVEASCTDPKTCSVCGETEGEALGHTVENWETVKEASCTEKGEKSGVCTTCGATVQEKIPKVEHTLGEWVVVKNPTSAEKGERSQSCTMCGEVINTEEFTLPPEEMEAQYKASCTAYDYNTIARDPEAYRNTYGKYTGEIIQVLETGRKVELRVDITKTSYGYTDTIYVFYTLKEGESRLLEGDIVTMYGRNNGTISYQSIFGQTITIPCVYAEYIDLN